ncbi:hypothetical protein RvY_00965 [Ramazzottius varieornatus]|uniref:Exonuclease domain-containing protein n=1 Tax=Ramazzottius varieornatus TaxID=947166 RepID=A0A1D1UIM7_RAMVA|nr:hypothetical protein RvY_00965 [Ramazzottius varieornatus]
MAARLTQQRVLMSKSKGVAPVESYDLAKDKRLVWVDLEMSGLELETHKIVEMACIVTDEELNIVAESPNVVINYPQLQFSDWCQTNFAKSGLLREITESKISLSEAENIMVSFLKRHVNPKMCPLAGNSVYMDRIFLRKYMPKFDDIKESIAELLFYRKNVFLQTAPAK